MSNHSPGERPLRVIQWGTGNAGRPALRAIIRDPRFDLVAVHAHSAEKIGRDAADLCGLDEMTGVIATDDPPETKQPWRYPL
jgi:hypothetical protein